MEGGFVALLPFPDHMLPKPVLFSCGAVAYFL